MQNIIQTRQRCKSQAHAPLVCFKMKPGYVRRHTVGSAPPGNRTIEASRNQGARLGHARRITIFEGVHRASGVDHSVLLIRL